MKARHFLPGFTFLLVALLNWQQVSAQNLPKGFAPGEAGQMPFYLNSFQAEGASALPFSPIRTAAEWEEMQALVITWTSYNSVLRQIVKNTVSECKVVIVCSDSNSVKSYLQSGLVPTANVRYVQAPFNSVWMRDYGANTAYTNDVDSLVLVDWIYNRPRPNDNAIPVVLGNYFNIPVYGTTSAPDNLIHTGGNFMSDGLGTGFSSELVVDENPSKTVAQIDQIMNDYMGLNSYAKMTVLPYDDIHHIDMHMKLIDENTLLVGQYPTGISDGPQIEANIQYVLSNYQSAFGRPYKVIRIPQPPTQNGLYPNQGGAYLTYANATIINKTILVPTYYTQYDTTALRIWREAMPGYNVVGINVNTMLGSGGAIHCITHSVGTADPLFIAHRNLTDTTSGAAFYPVLARLQHRSGIQNATLYYRTDTLQPYQTVPMALANAATHEWAAQLLAQPAGSTVYYYIQATSVSGKTQARPMPAPTGYWKFRVTGPASVQQNSASVFAESAYPNPSRGITCIPVDVASAKQGKLIVRNMLGQQVEVIGTGHFSGKKNYFVNTSGYTAGAYIIELQAGGQVFRQKLMVK